ncbi:ribonuclease P protein component [Janibacter sp. GXQ6167]|uniref:ribonuclease P protein component n=1 Tax=Janibacter sp. GXQ6167 TaxID=3240791 RepID=UPI0035269C6F
MPAPHRLKERADFTAVVRARGGSRRGSRLIVVHAHHTDARAGLPPRVGFVVSKAVGNAVVRNRVKRRLRAQVALLIDAIGSGTDVVVRANPASSTASSDALADDLRRLLPLGRAA